MTPMTLYTDAEIAEILGDPDVPDLTEFLVDDDEDDH